MEDFIKIISAFIIGYTVFVSAFYYLAKLMFHRIELDEETEKALTMYKKSRTVVIKNRLGKKYDPNAFKLSDSLKHRVNYNRI